MLVDVVAKGGNYLLNVGPDANGELPAEALDRMREIGDWMQLNGEAIYRSRPVAPYRAGKLRYTALKDGTVYAIYLADDNEALPARIRLEGLAPADGAQLQLLGASTPLVWKREGASTIVSLPAEVKKQVAGAFAWTIRISAVMR
jgi:alpha-L-fucosidase